MGIEQYFSEQMMQEMETQMNGMFGGTTFSFGKCFSMLMDGDMKGGITYLFQCLMDGLTGSVTASKNVLLIVLLLGILGSVFQILSDSFESRQVSKIGQYLFLLLAVILLMGVYENSYDICSGFIGTETEYLKLLLPAFCITLTVGSGMMTGYSYYAFTLFLLHIMQLLLQFVFLPCIRLYILFAVMNSVGRQKRFLKIQGLCEKVIEWGSRIGLYVGAGSFLIQGMLYPKLDGNKRSLVMKGIAMIPGIGDVSEGASGILIASAELTRNCIGIAGGIGLFVLVLIPIAKIAVSGAGMKLLSSVLEIIGEHTISDVMNKIGTAHFYFIRLLFCETVLILLSFAVIALCTNHG